MTLAPILRPCLKVLLRPVIVRDRSFLPDEEYIYQRGEGGTDGSPYPCYCTSRSGGTVQAQYGMRFMRLPFKDVASVLLNKEFKDVTEEDLIDLGKQNNETALFLAEDAKEYVKNYYHYQNLFIDNYYDQKSRGVNRSTIDAITEEIGHNDLLDKSPSFVIINALSVYYRICACFLAERRRLRKPVVKKDIKVVKGLLNSCFMRSAIFTNIYPVIEASYHYKDADFEKVKHDYDRSVEKHCMSFQAIENSLKAKDVSSAWIATIMKTLQKTMLSFPYLYIITKKSTIDYHRFLSFFAGYDTRNAQLLDEVQRRINDDSFSEEDLLVYLNDQKKRRTSNSRLDTEFLPSLVYLATETKDGFVPHGLVSFVLKHRKCRYFGYRIMWKKSIDRLMKKEEKLVGFPSLVSFGYKDERYFVDQQMAIFGEGRSFFKGLKGLEGTLVGKDSHNKKLEEAYNRLLVQSLFAKALYAVGRDVDYDVFSAMFAISFEIRPTIKAIKTEILERILKEFYSNAQDIEYYLPDPIDDKVAADFQKKSEELYDYTESLPEKEKELFYRFCDINYLHGF